MVTRFFTCIPGIYQLDFMFTLLLAAVVHICIDVVVCGMGETISWVLLQLA